MIDINILKEVFKSDGFITHNGLQIVKADESGSIVKVEIKNEHINANGAVHGGLLFSLADFGFGVAANCTHPITVTSSAAVTYIAPCIGTKELICECKELSRYHRACVYEAVIKNDSGETVCVAQLNGVIKEDGEFIAKTLSFLNKPE